VDSFWLHKILEAKGVFVISDILCNAVYNRLERVMKTAFRDELTIHFERNVPTRVVANMLGIGRVAEAVEIR
jgi:glutamate dehydrogenase/leucine dehydrogenase